jgi:hypothetical protein
MRTRVINLACVVLAFITTGIPSVSRAQTNSWIQSGDGAWQNPANWSLSQAPTNTQSLVITNDISKTITIDATTSGSFSNTLTVTDVILSTPSGATNILDLSNAGTTTPLSVLNNFIVSSGGLLRLTGSGLLMQTNVNAAMTNSTAVLSNGVLTVDGTLLLNSNGVVVANTGIYVGQDTNANGLVLFAGGQLLLTNTPPSAIGVNGIGQMIISNGQVQAAANFSFVGSGKGSQGALTVAGGNFVASPNARLVIGMETGAVGVVSVTSGNLIMTNSLMTLVGGDGAGQLNLSGGTNVFGSVEVGGDSGAQGTLSVAGSVNILQAGLYVGASLGSTGAVWLTGGQLIATNFSTSIASWGYGVATVSNGSWVGTMMFVGEHGFAAVTNNVGSITTPAQTSYGLVNLDGGSMTLYTKLLIGNCPTGGIGVVNITGGALYVTNAAHNAYIDLRDGQIDLNGGLLQTDILIITNPCGLFVRGGGTLIVGSMVLDPNLDADGDGIPNGWEQAYGLDPLNAADANADPDGDGFSNLQEFLAGTDPTNNASNLRILSIAPQGSDVRITWSAVTNKTYLVQAAPNTPDGSFTNAFANLGTVTVPATPAITTTNYVDAGAVTNGATRFYRIKLLTSP